MFGISFVEFFVIAIAAILFIGPEKLPELAQKLGGYMRQFRILREDFTRKVHDPKAWNEPPSIKKPEESKSTNDTPPA